MIGLLMAPNEASTSSMRSKLQGDANHGPPRVRARPRAERRRPKANLMRVDALCGFRRPGMREAEG